MVRLLYIFILICTTVTIIHGNLQVSVSVFNHDNVTIKYSGNDKRPVTGEDIKTFKINSANLNNALKKFYGRRPNNYYFRSPTPWGDLYKKYNWDEVKRVLFIRSATLKSIERKPTVVVSQDFENYSTNKTIKVNTGLSHTVENSVASSWSTTHELTVSQEIEYDVNVILSKLSGTTGISYTSSWGKNVEKTETITIGTTTTVETELEPLQAATAVLTATKGTMEVEVVYVAILTGNLAVNFKRPYKGHHFKAPLIGTIMKSGDLNNELITTETIRVGMYMDASLKVYDKLTGLPL